MGIAFLLRFYFCESLAKCAQLRSGKLVSLGHHPEGAGGNPQGLVLVVHCVTRNSRATKKSMLIRCSSQRTHCTVQVERFMRVSSCWQKESASAASSSSQRL